MSSLTAKAESLSQYEAGFRADVNLGNGSPANDILGGSFTGRYRWNDQWLIGAAIEFASYDYERPYEDLGLTSFSPSGSKKRYCYSSCYNYAKK